MNAFLKLMLKGSAASLFALTLAATGCSDADKETETGAGGEDGGGKGGTPSTSGSSNGGDSTGKGGEGGAGATTPGGADAGGAGGTEAGGADAGGADAGGAGGASSESGTAVAKFCNNLTFGTEQDPMDTTFILEIGEGASKVSFTATTGACAPAACSALPVGTDIPYALFDADAPETEIDGGTLDILDGEVLAFYTDLSAGAEPSPVAAALTFDVEIAECKDITYAEVYE